MKAEALSGLRSIINDADARPRERVGAIRALATIAKVEQDSIRNAVHIKRLGQGDHGRERAEETAQTLREFLEETSRVVALEEAEGNQSTNGTDVADGG
jgi:hypothetical protein